MTTPEVTAMAPWPDPTNVTAVRAWLDQHPADPAAVRNWAAPLLGAADRTGPTPNLGTPAWRSLPDGDPRKLAALVYAALARLAETTPAAVALRLDQEIQAENRAVVDRLKTASLALSSGQDWTAVAQRPSYAELCRRRNELPGRAA